MSKRGYLSRYLLLVKRLKIKPYSSYEELQQYIERQVEFLQLQDDSLQVGFSKRTLQRDIREIRTLFGINIEYSTRAKGYYIQQDEGENMNFQRMIEAFDLFSSLNLSSDLASFIHLEKRKPQGTENLYGLLHAIKNRLRIKFEYQKFWDEKKTLRLAEPYAIKEYKGRWYLIAMDQKDKAVKTFALDRLKDLEITSSVFKKQNGYNVEEAFRYSFGIISPDYGEPEEIILSFDPFQGKYIKTLPLHDSQEVLLDTTEEFRIKLRLYITHDLIMEMLSFGGNVEVLSPKRLAEEVKAAHLEAYKLYSS